MKNIFSCIRWSLLIIVFLSVSKKDDNSVVKSPDQPVITETGQPAGPADETTIGPDGGIASSSNGLLSVDIP